MKNVSEYVYDIKRIDRNADYVKVIYMKGQTKQNVE